MTGAVMARSSPQPARHALAAPDNGSAVEGSFDALRVLEAHAVPVAPTVATRLHRELRGDPAAIVQTAAWMTEAQRRGTESLPDPLPLLDAVEDAVGDGRLEPWEFEVLVAACVCVDDRTEVLLEFAARPIDELIAGGVSRHLAFVAGHFAFADPRMRVWVHGSASLAERTSVHAALAAIYARHRDDDLATWHRALSTLQGDAALVPPLLRMARDALARGEAERAHAVAREATSHAPDGPPREQALLVTGVAAAAAGLVDDAVRALAAVVGSADAEVAAEAMPAYLACLAWRSGGEPGAALEGRLDELARGGVRARRAVARARALAACLCAERGERAAARRWAAAIDEVEHPGEHRVAYAWMAVHAPDHDPSAIVALPVGQGLLPVLAGSLLLALGGDVATAVRHAGQAVPAGLVRRDDVIAGLECSPVARAYRAVVTALLRTWAGDVAGALDALRRGSLEGPVATPFDGLALRLARRLEISVDGRPGVLSRSLATTGAGTSPADALLDRALVDFLAGRDDESATRATLHRELHGPRGVLAIPGVDELPVGDEHGPDAGVGERMPPDAALARRARALAAGATHPRELEASIALARDIESPFERARAEAALGAAWASFGEHLVARRHLVAAETLFEEAGADAWRALARERMARLPHERDAASVSTHDTASSRTDVLAWSDVLTERELEVARLVVEGAGNREIAARLFVSVRTVEVHVGRILAKLGARSRVELIVLAHRAGVTT
ncbi:helix-turn-helix transcriptional regulator [Protaetiibacter sp. SSC-01]|uniref:helix-turn-helix transcriptional regulator n=1 Tax=Protaetiibacter sp. SSC-01 TaxID=2759943 RepID=UPI001656AC7B|nr:helix-turn-helix transcriptional regulator [Protaetiibacter sp. SSC-01]QNO38577.1 helix-turn-helix transcriptional regulator [Protaetiibacter sp. SSC-01]